MTTTTLLIGAAAIATSTIFIFLRPSPSLIRDPDALPSALLPSYTSHARLLPTPSKHAFSYPLIYVGVDIDAVESGSLDVGRVFKYGGSPWTKVLGLRSWNYLTPGPSTLRQKLDKLLEDHGVCGRDRVRGWMVSMPSILGFEGINPLTVWYIYDTDRRLSCIILEVHNTFGEKHAYILKRDSEYIVDPNEGYDYAWIFPRTFHVSPFNSRNGYYRLDLLDPFPQEQFSYPEKPQYKVFLRLLTSEKTPKLTAVVGSHPTHQPITLDPQSIPQILFTLLRWPATLFLSTPRILYHAYILQYLKKLAMFPRPEPRRKGQDGVWNPPQNFEDGVGVPIGWQDMSSSERWLERVFSDWAAQRSKATGVRLKIERPAHQSTQSAQSAQSSSTQSNPSDATNEIVVTTSDPCFFTNLCLQPTARHFTILAPELLTTISDPDLFVVFLQPIRPSLGSTVDRLLISTREKSFRWHVSFSLVSPTPDLWTYSPQHLTDDWTQSQKWWLLYILYSTYLFARLEEGIMYFITSRFVERSAPWEIWYRALTRLYAKEDELLEGWEDLGSIRYD